MSNTGRIANETGSTLSVIRFAGGNNASTNVAPIPARDAIVYNYNPGDSFLLISPDGRYKRVYLNAQEGNVTVYSNELQKGQGDCKTNNDCNIQAACHANTCIPDPSPPSPPRQIDLTALLPMMSTIIPQLRDLVNSPLLTGFVDQFLARPEVKALIPDRAALVNILSDPVKVNNLIQRIKENPQILSAFNRLLNDPNTQTALKGFLAHKRQVTVVESTGTSLGTIILWVVVILAIIALIYYILRKNSMTF